MIRPYDGFTAISGELSSGVYCWHLARRRIRSIHGLSRGVNSPVFDGHEMVGKRAEGNSELPVYRAEQFWILAFFVVIGRPRKTLPTVFWHVRSSPVMNRQGGSLPSVWPFPIPPVGEKPGGKGPATQQRNS